ncbi:uncharacterized protein PpBr36_09563 [Pyricularia pennisetigena]|uniref:uncharacterized protein n=1 Tax=Pyricularia pennisetigena TaxID=1578925 RepID=UPI001150CEC4|nr:uncharacterized protein PpBr36_09563 [Pyricularia pennisetigena]TLS21641.1 hypothetical protein PpBr36_09563 [Pyricularia pennisetigena]
MWGGAPIMGIDLLGRLRILTTQVVCPSGPVIINITYLWVAHETWADRSGGMCQCQILPGWQGHTFKLEAICSQSFSRRINQETCICASVSSQR